MDRNYFYYEQSEQFAFYAVPKVLYESSEFQDMSLDAIALYSILLDRMNLSRRNKWMDEEGRIYIIFTIEEMTKVLRCGETKAIRVLNELEKKYGLVEKKKQGLGKPNLLYVKNFVRNDFIYNRNDGYSHISDTEDIDNGNESSDHLIEQPSNIQIESSDLSNIKSNYTDYNYTDCNNTNSFNLSIYQDCDTKSNANMALMEGRIGTKEDDKFLNKPNYMGLREYYREKFEDMLELSEFEESEHKERFKEIINIMVDVCTSPSRTVQIENTDVPKEAVVEAFEQLNYDKVEYVLKCINNLPYQIKNTKKYLIVALYNASKTYYNDIIATEYRRVNGYDKYGGEEKY